MAMRTDLQEKLRANFREEARELLTELDEAILALEAQPDDTDLIGRIFRAVHTIKGSGSTAGLKEIAGFTHKLEEVFNEAREGRLSITPAITDLTLEACDLIGQLLGTDQPQTLAPEMAQLTARLAQVLPATSGAVALGAPAQPKPETASRQRFDIFFRPNPEIFYTGNDPVNVLSELVSLGDCQVRAQLAGVPVLDGLEAEKCYLAWEIDLVTDRPESHLKEIFAFVEEGGEVRIQLAAVKEAPAWRNQTAFPPASLRDFFEESQEQLVSMEESLLALETCRDSRDLVNALFRGLHNLKGNAGVLLSEKERSLPPRHPLLYIQRVGHATESLVDQLRSAEVILLDDDQVELLFASFDLLKRQVAAFFQERLEPVIDEGLLRKLGLKAETFAEAKAVATPSDTHDEWVLFFQTAAQCHEAMRQALDLAESDPAARPATAKTYLRLARTLLAATRCKDLVDLSGLLEKQVASIEAPLAAKQTVPAETWAALRDGLPRLTAGLRQLEVHRPGAPAATAAVEVDKPRKAGPPKTAASAPQASTSIRVDQDKLEKLLRVAGELLVARTVLPTLARKVAALDGQSGLAQEVRDAGAQISRIANDLQSTVMAIRMLPLKSVFQKFPRMIRDVAHAMGKEINFTTRGDDTELDKTVLEQIGDPLMHLVRNAVDHGIEKPEERQARGKPPQGQIKIAACNEGTQVVIRISDDGQGLDAAYLKRKAVEKRVISAAEAQAMSDAQAYLLIFAAGFSTAEKVTDVSGRGVGMDVVRTNLNHLHGTIEIDTRLHQGTTFTIKLPASLMVSKGVLLRANDQEFILPMGQIRDLVKIPRRQIATFNQQKIAQVRGKIYPLASLQEILGEGPRLKSGPDTAPPPDEEDECSVAIIQNHDQHFGLVVDRFESEVEIIVKPLTDTLGELKTYLGAAIMGDGRLVLVLNPAELVPPPSSLAA